MSKLCMTAVNNCEILTGKTSYVWTSAFSRWQWPNNCAFFIYFSRLPHQTGRCSAEFSSSPINCWAQPQHEPVSSFNTDFSAQCLAGASHWSHSNHRSLWLTQAGKASGSSGQHQEPHRAGQSQHGKNTLKMYTTTSSGGAGMPQLLSGTKLKSLNHC